MRPMLFQSRLIDINGFVTWSGLAPVKTNRIISAFHSIGIVEKFSDTTALSGPIGPICLAAIGR